MNRTFVGKRVILACTIWWGIVAVLLFLLYQGQPDPAKLDDTLNQWRRILASERLAATLTMISDQTEVLGPSGLRPVYDALRDWEETGPDADALRDQLDALLRRPPVEHQEEIRRLERNLITEARTMRRALQTNQRPLKKQTPLTFALVWLCIGGLLILPAWVLRVGYLIPERNRARELRTQLAGYHKWPAIANEDDEAVVKEKLDAFMGGFDEAQRALNLINSLSEGLLIISPDGVIEWANKSIHRMLDYRPGKLEGMAFTDIYVKLKSINVQGFFKQRETFREEELFKTSDGKVIPVRFSSSFLFDEHMEVVGFVCIAKDISREKAAEEELQRQNEWFKVTMSSIDEGVLTSDRDGKISFLNEIAADVTGWSVDDALEKDLDKVFRLLDPESNSPLQIVEGSVSVPFTLERRDCLLVRKDGEIIEIEKLAAPIRLATGKIQGMLVVFRDITRSKRDALELLQAKEKAEAAAMAKAQFLANMSHEIRTPLNGIIGMTGLLMDTQLTTEQRESAMIVRSSGEALLALINDILDFSKNDAGKLELEIIEFDPRNTVEEVGDLLAQKAHDKNLEIVLLLHHEVPTRVMGDPGRLRQILLNLADNAIKFTTEGEILIEVALIPAPYRESEEVELRFDVKDNGIGIPEDRQARLFKPFSQVDASTTRKFGGTGLGLAICKQLVEAMGGHIWVESIEGKGATFSFTLRFGKTDEKPIKIPELDFSDLSVLVIDGNPGNRRALQVQLQHREAAVFEAATGGEGLAILEANKQKDEPIDLVILDFRLPEDDALQVADAIHAHHPKTRLLLLTSIPRRGDARQVIAHHIDGYLTKPVKLQQLYENIAAVMHPDQFQKETPNLITSHTLREADQKRAKILVVEDNAVNQRVAVRFLEKAGYRCDVAANGLEAIDAVRRIPYHLILMDCQMPEMDGYQATRAIRDFQDRHIPIIAMTANAMRTDRQRCLDAGMDDYLAKPLDRDKLFNVIEQYLPPEDAV